MRMNVHARARIFSLFVYNKIASFFQIQNAGQCRTLQDIFQLLAGQSCSEMKDNAGQISKFS